MKRILPGAAVVASLPTRRGPVSRRTAPRMNDPGDLFFLGWGPTSLSLRPYRDRDERRFTARPDFAAALAAEGGLLPLGPKWTLVHGTRPIAVGGVEDQGGDVWVGWAYAGDLTPRQWLFGARMARICLDWVRRSKKARVSALADNAAAARLLTRAGVPMPRPAAQREAA